MILTSTDPVCIPRDPRSLGREWSELARRRARPVVFLTPEWLAVARAHDPREQLTFAVGDPAVGVIGLARDAAIISFAGGELTDEQDDLAPAGRERQAAALVPRWGGRVRGAGMAAPGRAARRRRGRRRPLRVRVRRDARPVQRGIRPGAERALGRDRLPCVRDPRSDRGGAAHVRPSPRGRAVQVRPRRRRSLARAPRGDAPMTRVAMLSVHACPLAKLGGRDSGGMNVYVRELARDLGARGIEVDVFTRWRERYDPRIQQLGPNARVIHVESGPIGYWPKMAVYEHLDQFGEKLLEHVAAEGKRYDLVHAHYWLSAKVARTLAEHWRVPRIQMFHTLGLVKREVLDEDIDGESDVRVAIEREAVRESAAIVAASTIELAELRQLYRADPSGVAVIPCGVDPEVFKPVRQADAREALGRDQCEPLVLFVGRLEQTT